MPFNSISLMNITRAVKHLIIANILFFLLALVIPTVQDNAALYFFENPNFHWWQAFSHLFMHASIGHIFFNMFALYSFGVPLESYFGSNRFIFFYFACGLGAAFLHTAVNYYEFHSVADVLLREGYTQEQNTNVVSQGKIYTDWQGILSQSQLKDLFNSFSVPAV